MREYLGDNGKLSGKQCFYGIGMTIQNALENKKPLEVDSGAYSVFFNGKETSKSIVVVSEYRIKNSIELYKRGDTLRYVAEEVISIFAAIETSI